MTHLVHFNGELQELARNLVHAAIQTPALYFALHSVQWAGFCSDK